MGTFAKGRTAYVIIAAGFLSMAWLGWRYLLPERVPEPESAEQLRDALENGDSTKARAAAAAKLGEMRDEDSMPLLIRAMEDPDPMIRGRAGAAVQKIMKADYYFRATDPPEQRSEVVAKIKRDWDGYLRNKTPQPAASSGTQAGPQ